MATQRVRFVEGSVLRGALKEESVDTSYAERSVDTVLRAVRAEVLRAMERFPRFNSPHEGKAVIEEELDELWELVKANHGSSPAARIEAKQIAAMAIRYIVDCDPLADLDALYEEQR